MVQVEVGDSTKQEATEELSLSLRDSPFEAGVAEIPLPEGEEVMSPPPQIPNNDAKVGGRLRKFAAA